jgi:predicted TIM-barrel fold metal-dependent hydrolase
MPYCEMDVVHDADAHIMETPTWLRDHADPSIRGRIDTLTLGGGNELRQTGDPEAQLRDLDAAFDNLTRRHRSDEYLADEAVEVMNRKNYAATGSFLAEDRPRALDLLGFSSQLVFNTFHNRRLYDWEHGGDLDLAYGAARAHNRGMVEFCSVDDRLLPACYVPLADFDRSEAMAAEAVAMGAAALLVPSGCPSGHSPSHRLLDPVWACAQDAGIPIVFHVGGTDDLIDPDYFNNGLPIPPDFHGGEENFRSVDYLGIPHPPAQTLATLIFDGVLDRFPDLRFGRGPGRWNPQSTPSPVTRNDSGPWRCGRPTTCVARCASRPTRPKTSAGSSSSRAPRSACSPPTTRMSKAAVAPSSDSRHRSATRLPRSVPASTATTSST